MKYYGTCPGSCGEFIQGILNDKEYLVSYAIDMYSSAIIKEDINIIKGPEKSRKAMNEVFKYFDIDEKESDNLSLHIESNIPIGKGMASSSADIGATIKATLLYLNKELDSNAISKIATKVEPTDSIFIEENTIFDPLNGEVHKKLGHIYGMKVLVLEPEETLNTLSIRSRDDYYDIKRKNIPKLRQAYDMIEEAFNKNDCSLLGKACTISGILNENIHKKEALSEIIKISKDFGAYGVNIAHSGTVIGILLDEDCKEDKLKELLILNNIHKKYKKMYPLQIVRGGVKGGIFK